MPPGAPPPVCRTSPSDCPSPTLPRRLDLSPVVDPATIADPSSASPNGLHELAPPTRRTASPSPSRPRRPPHAPLPRPHGPVVRPRHILLPLSLYARARAPGHRRCWHRRRPPRAILSSSGHCTPVPSRARARTVAAPCSLRTACPLRGRAPRCSAQRRCPCSPPPVAPTATIWCPSSRCACRAHPQLEPSPEMAGRRALPPLFSVGG